MAELTISTDEIRSAIANYTSSYSAGGLPRGGRRSHHRG